MKAKKTLIDLRVNYGYNKGSKTQEPDYLIRRAINPPKRVEISHVSKTRPWGPVDITLMLK